MSNINTIVTQAGQLYENQNFEQAKNILEKYLQDNIDAEAYNLLAMVCFSLKNSDDAIAYLKKAIELDSKNISFLNNLAIAYLNIDINQAQNYFEQVLAIDPLAFITNKTLGHIYFKQGKMKEAIACYEVIIKDKKIDFEIALNYAQLLSDTGEHSRAIESLNLALNFEENNPIIQNLSADIFYKMGLPNEATKHYKEFLSLSNQPMDYYIFSKIQKLWSDYADKFYNYTKIKETTYIDAYQKEIQRSVKDKVVFEYGRNGGLFAMMAAKAGAKKVYICESDQYIAGQITEVIKSNGYENIIEIIQKNLYQIDNIKADIAIIDRFGTHIIDDNITLDMRYINQYILKDDAKILPKSVTLNGTTVQSSKFRKTNYSFDMRGLSMFEKPYLIKNLNELNFQTTSELFKIIDLNLKYPKNTHQLIIEPKYLQENSNGIACWYELTFSDDNKVQTYLPNTNHFEQLIWLTDIDGTNHLEVIHQNNQFFIEVIQG